MDLFKDVTIGSNRLSIKIRGILRHLFVVMFMLGIVSTSSLYAQEAKLSMQLSGAEIKEVLKQIKSQTRYTFIYHDEDLAGVAPVTIDKQNASVSDILNAALQNNNLSYEIKDDVIIIKVKPQTNATSDLEVVGKVTDENGDPVPGVNVILTEFFRGTVTDINGNYKIEINDVNAEISFSFVGFEKQVVKVAGRNKLDVTLKLAVSEIEDVVVTGMFVRKSESYTGSAVVVTSDDLLKLGNRNLVTSLRNFDPSFNIVENNEFGGDPNRLPDIQIRGNSSLPNVEELQDDTRAQLNTPLIIMDGFESSLRKLMDLDETEVESITILKDASATAIYGSRAANGVVVITTKAPQEGKLTVTYRGTATVNVPDLTSYNVLNAREKLELEKAVRLYDSNSPETDLALKGYYNYLLNEVNSGVDTYWLSKPLQVGIGQRHSVRLEGGDKRFRYSGSIQYFNNKGVMKESGRDVLNGTINLAYTYNKIRFSNQLIAGFTRADESTYGSFSDYVKMNPYWRTHDEDGNLLKVLGEPNDGSSSYPRWNSLPGNPLYNATVGMFEYEKNMEITDNLSLIWDVAKGLKFTGRLGITNKVGQSHLYKPADHTDFANYTGDNLFRKGSYDYGISNYFRYNASVNLFYTHTFHKKHTLTSGLDLNANNTESSQYNMTVEGFPNDNLNFIMAGLQYAEGSTPSGSETLSRNVGMTSFLNYSFNNMYFADFSYRLDGSSQFGSDQRFAPFWSAGLGWNIHHFEAIKNSRYINRLKVRGSIGETGSQNFDPYQALSTYRYYTNNRYINGNGVYLIALGNEDLKWQQTLQSNIGMETQLFRNRFSFEFDYYIKTTDGMISSVNIPLANGYSSYVDNIGKVENRGFELRSTVYVIRNTKKRFSWSVSATAAHNTNKIVEISEALEEAQKELEEAETTSANRFYRVGESTSAIYAVQSLGIDPSNGKEVYIDRDGYHTYFWDPLAQVAAGDTEPWLRGSINSNIRWKSLSVNASFGYKWGGQQYNNTLMNKVENANYQYNVDSRVYHGRWQNPGDDASFKGLLVTTKTYNTTRFIQDENTFNCQNINVSYDIESKRLKKSLGFRTLTLTANMSDVFYTSTIHRERGTSYPFDRQFSFSINAIF